MTRACVIGAGLGGLALAIRLQSAGVETTLIEARQQVGGSANSREREGFIFDAGPTAIVDPAGLDELWQLNGDRLENHVELLPISPIARFNWPDGTNFDYSNDPAALRREIARLAPADAAGYEEFALYASHVHKEGMIRLGKVPFHSWRTALSALPGLARHQAWRSYYSMISHFIKSDRLRSAFSVQSLLAGANPASATAMLVLIHAFEQQSGTWWPRGGFGALTGAMASLFGRLGGTLRLHDPVLHVHTLGDRASEVETLGGWRQRFDAIASNADVVHTYRDLLASAPRGPETARRLARKSFSPGMFVVHFGLEGSWPGIPHRMVLFPQRYKTLLADIFEHGVLPRDFVLFLDHPSVTDPTVAPPGKSTFRAAIPVAHMGKLPIDWDQVGPLIEQRILEEVGRRLIPDLDDRVVTKSHYSPRDFALDMNAFHGSAFSLELAMSQSGFLRPHNRDGKLRNFYLVGAGTHPGAGVQGVVFGARITAQLMLEELR